MHALDHVSRHTSLFAKHIRHTSNNYYPPPPPLACVPVIIAPKLVTNTKAASRNVLTMYPEQSCVPIYSTLCLKIFDIHIFSIICTLRNAS